MEDHLFFPMAAKYLSTEEKDSLTDQFAEQPDSCARPCWR
jgi:hypothetical protein